MKDDTSSVGSHASLT